MPAPRVVQIENFRCLRQVELEFEPLTVLVGPNASGKTALLDALGPETDFTTDDVWQRQNLPVKCEGKLADGAGFGGTATTSISSGVHRHFRFSLPWRLLRLQLHPAALRRHNALREEHSLNRDGGNLANVFGSLPRQRVRFDSCGVLRPLARVP